MRLRFVPLAAVPLALAACGAGTSHPRPRTRRHEPKHARKPTQPPPRASRRPKHKPSPAARLLGLPPVSRGPIPGYVLIADRNNNRLLLVSPSKRVVWRFPGPRGPGGSFRDPDDAFFTPGYRRIVTNEEFNDTIAQIDPRRRRIVWSYGTPGVAGAAKDELSNPDDAYVLENGDVVVADIQNCRVLWLTPAKRIVREIGSAGACSHDPPRSLVSPNGDTPLADGGLLVTEIGGYVDRFDARGNLRYSVRTPTSYPSDAQLLPNGNILVAGFDTPGRVDELKPSGRVVWTYGPRSGPGSLDRPSLAVRWPNGMIAVTDDWHHRVVVIDPKTKRIVWQYGHFDVPSARTGYLSKPDGLDLLPALFKPRRHGRKSTVSRLRVARVGTLPEPVSRLSAVALPGGHILAAGGLVSGSSSTEILAGPPSRLSTVGRLPAPTHDAAAAVLGRAVYVFGGGQAVSTSRIDRIDPGSGAARGAGSLGEPLSDLGATVAGRRVYLVGGYTGTQYATAVLRFRPGKSPTVVARLPSGLRYAGVAAIGPTVYVAGGLATSGETDTVLAVDPRSGGVRRVTRLPAPVAHAPLAALDGELYLIGGTSTAGAPLRAILRIDPMARSVARVGTLPRPLADAAAVTVGGSVYVLGGAGPSPSRAVFGLTPGLH